MKYKSHLYDEKSQRWLITIKIATIYVALDFLTFDNFNLTNLDPIVSSS